jgi:UPF0755 protein
VKRAFGIFLLAFAALATAALYSPFQGFKGEVYVDIPRGMPTSAMARELTDAGVIHYPWQFRLARLLRPSASLQAGEYHFTQASSVQEVFARMARGDIYFFEFTVPEGSNIFDISRSLESQGVMKSDAFLHAAEDTSIISDLAPGARTLEGYLFPSTYRLTHSTTPEQLCKRMTDEFRRTWRKLTDGTPQQTADPRRTVTLASLVEKETAAPEERPVIASVFSNRLAKSMRLECDPTTIYAALLDNRYRGVIHKSDLANANPYNTYQSAGLPPGPIANPGAESLAAALTPAQTDFLFFVAKPAGGAHQFSATMAQHEKAVVAYRHAQKHQTH